MPQVIPVGEAWLRLDEDDALRYTSPTESNENGVFRNTFVGSGGRSIAERIVDL